MRTTSSASARTGEAVDASRTNNHRTTTAQMGSQRLLARQRRAFAPACACLESVTIALALAAGASPQKLQPIAGDIQLRPAAISYSEAQSAPSDLYGPNNILHAYSPADMCAAYGVDQLHAEGWTGKGQTIVIVDSYGSPTALQDLQTFSSYYGLPAPDLTIVYVDGTPTYNATALKASELGSAEETSLDLQWAHVIAPDAKLVLMVSNPYESDGVQGFPSMLRGIAYAAQQYPGSPISQSYATAEQTFDAAESTLLQQYETVYQQADAAGCSPLVAAGDWGTANGVKQLQGSKSSDVYPYQTVCWPASSPSVTAVGGTWLQYHWRWDPQANLADVLALGDPHPFRNGDPVALAYMNSDDTDDETEAVWREDWLVFPHNGSANATGGGLSTIFPTPPWQASLPANLTQGARALPDVSWNAAVNGGVWTYITQDGGWSVYGGTSAGTPQIAGVVALVNQMRATLGKGPIGHLAPKLYQLPASDFNDIVPQTFGSGADAATVGDNFRYGYDVPGLPTTAGYDLTTGLGSPKAYNFVYDLATLFP